MSDSLAAFIDARWKWAKGEALKIAKNKNIQVTQDSQQHYKLAGEVMDEGFSDMLSILKEPINQHSNVKGKNVNALFGNTKKIKPLLDAGEDEKVAGIVQEFFKKNGLDLEINVSNN